MSFFEPPSTSLLAVGAFDVTDAIDRDQELEYVHDVYETMMNPLAAAQQIMLTDSNNTSLTSSYEPSRRVSHDEGDLSSNMPEITPEEIERLMMFDMLRQNFKNDSDITALD
jgi:hypothetical protein